jgi:hypothetical protein
MCFVRHIESTTHQVLYKLPNIHVPSNISFPRAQTLTLINCHRVGVYNIFTPFAFPNLERVQYISGHPGDYNIDRRFGDYLQWEVPHLRYAYYEYLRAKKGAFTNPDLVKTFIRNKRYKDGMGEFDITYEMDLVIPDWGEVDGDWWSEQWLLYIGAKTSLQRLADET